MLKKKKKGCMKLLNLFLPNDRLSIFRYSIDRHTDLERYFTINADDGNIKTIKALDREEIAWHNISVFAVEVRKYFTELFCYQFYKFCCLPIDSNWYVAVNPNRNTLAYFFFTCIQLIQFLL